MSFELDQEDDVVASAVPAGEYLVRVAHLEMAEGNYGKQIKFRLEVCDGEHTGSSIKSWVDARLTPTSLLSEYVRTFVFNGKDIPKGYKLKSSELKGTHGYVTCEDYEGNNGSVWPRVVGMSPVDGDDMDDETSPYDE
jgi:hypothetical protein